MSRVFAFHFAFTYRCCDRCHGRFKQFEVHACLIAHRSASKQCCTARVVSQRTSSLLFRLLSSLDSNSSETKKKDDLQLREKEKSHTQQSMYHPATLFDQIEKTDTDR